MKNEAGPCILSISQINTCEEGIQTQKAVGFWDRFQGQTENFACTNKYFLLIDWLVSPRHGRLKAYFAFFMAQKFFFLWMKTFIKHWVLELTVVLLLVFRLFYLILWAIPAFCCSQQCWHISIYWNLLTSGCLSACSRSPIALSPCSTVSLARFCSSCRSSCIFPSLIMEQYLPASMDQKGQTYRIHHAWLADILK